MRLLGPYNFTYTLTSTTLCRIRTVLQRHQWNRSAVARGHRSHTDRWRKEDGYRRQCYANENPQWLLYHDGTYAALDGRDRR